MILKNTFLFLFLFSFSFISYSQTPTVQDCEGAIAICQNVYSETDAYSGTGNIQDEIDPSTGCLMSGEKNDIWYTFTASSSGNVCFTIQPNNAFDDYDWAVYDITNNPCSDIYSGTAPEVACNYSGSSGDTGPNGGSGAQEEACIAVNAGETYVVNVSQFSLSTDGYTIDFGASSATIFDNTDPVVNNVQTISCGATSVTFDFSESVLCSSADLADFQFTGPGGPYTLSNLSGANCSAGGSQEDQFTVDISPAITVSGSFSMCLIGGAGFVEDLCGNVASAGCWTFNVNNGVVANAGADVTTCLDENGNVIPVRLGGNPSGGTGPYTYEWTPTTNLTNSTVKRPWASPSTNTTYTVTATDANGCAAIDQVDVTISNLNAPTMATTPESCLGANDGTVSATAINGTPAYTYSWTPSGQTAQTATGLSPGSYSVDIIDANGCGATNNITVVAGLPILAGFTPPANQCLTSNNFSFTNTGEGPGGGTNYSWDFGDGSGTSTQQNPNYTYSAAGTYTVTQTITSGACTETATADITVYDMPLPTGTTTPALCNGDATGTATLTTPIGPGPGAFSFAWDATAGNQITNPASNLAAGSYTVTVTDQTTTCTGQVTLTVAEPVVLTASANNVAPSCANGSNGTASANGIDGTAGYTYSWNTAPVQTSQTATGLTAGTYTATVTDANGCTATISTTLIDPPGIVLNSSMTQANCGQSDGSATVNVTSGGSGNFSYSWDSSPVQNTQTATNIIAGTYTATVTDITNGCIAYETINVTSTTGITAATTFINDALCNGSLDGQASAAPSGGTAPYTYSWNTTPVQTTSTITAAAGTYTVVITDANGCTGTDVVTINEPTLLAASIPTNNPASCFGLADGDATATASGGTATYTYLWDAAAGNQITATATGLAAGSYTVTVTDANGCTDTESVTILDGPQMSSTITGTNVSCFGGNNGTINLTPSGGTAPYTYVWNNGSSSEDPTGLSAGTHNVTITSQEGCTTNATIDIIEPTQLVAQIDAITDVICNGESNGLADGSASNGTSPYTYSWNTTPIQNTASANSLPIGIYTFTVTDANLCTATVTATITEPLPVDATTSSTTAYCGVDQGSVTITPTTGTAPFTFSWDSASVNLGSTATITDLFPGTYNILLEDANSCKFTTSVTVIAAPGGTASISSFTDVNCFNGSDGTATVSTSGAFPGFTYLWDASANNQTTNPATGLSAGAYNVAVTDIYGCIMNTNVTINEATILATTISSTSKICVDACNAEINSVTTGGTTPYSYIWDDPTNQISQSATGLCADLYELTVTDNNGCVVTDTLTINDEPAMTFNSSNVPANCNQADGSATANVTANGIAPYTYEWLDGGTVISNNQTLSNVAANTYMVVATDALGCSVTGPVTIPNLSGPSITIDTTFNVLCFGGNDGYIEVQVTGGVFPYTYLWNDPTGQTTPSASNLTAGDYVVVVTDDNGCSVSISETITEPAPVSLTAGGVDPTCFGYNDGTTWVNATGGTAPYTYLWNDPAAQTTDATNLLVAGNYLATVVDVNNCFDTISVLLIDPQLFSVNVTGNNVQCFNACDGDATANLTNGIAPFTYLWDDPSAQTNSTASALCSSNINVAITDADGCIANGSLVITEPALLVISEDLHGNVSCNGGNDGFSSAAIAGGTGPYNYSWNINGAIVSTSQAANNLVTGSYLVTVTDANGCTDNVTIVITEPNALTASTIPTDADCFGNNTGSAIVTAAEGTSPYTYQWSDVALQQTSTATGLIAGLYDVTITDALGCTTTITGTEINEPTQLSLNTSTISSTCGTNNGSASVTVGGGSIPYNYQWNDPNTQATALANGLVAGPYSISVTDNNGCIATTTADIMDLGSPTITITATTDVSCSSASDGSATTSTIGGTAPYTYSWNTTPAQTTAVANNLSGQTYSVTVTDANGCIASTTTTINENSALSAVISGSTNITCKGLNNGDASVTVAGGGTPYTYLWNDGMAQTTPTATALISGTYDVTVSDVNGCTTTETVTLTEPQILDIRLDSINNVTCNTGNDGYINIDVTGGTLGYNYVWTPNVSSGATASGLIAGNYSVIITDANGCTATYSDLITEPNQLSVNISSTPSTCGQPNGTATVTIATGSTPTYTYLWNDPSNQNTTTATGLNTSLYTVKVTDANGCFVNSNTTVGNQLGPIIDSLIVTPVSCNGGSDGTAEVFTSGNGPYTYAWDDPFTQTNQAATGLSASPPLYTVIVTDINGCSSSSSGQINEPAILNVFINSPDTICYGEPLQLFANANGGTLPYNYLWGSGLTGQGPVIENPTTSTTYTVTVLDGSPAGCQASITKTVVVRNPLVINTSDVTICQGEVAALNATAIGGNQTMNIQYFWMEIDSLTGNTSSTGVINPVNPIQLTPLVTTDYMVWVEDGCSTSDTVGVTVTVNDSATANILSVVDVCLGDSQDFALTHDIGVLFNWDFNSDGNINQTTTDTNTTYTYPAAGTYDVTVTVETAQGCLSTIISPQLTTVNPGPIADFTTEPNPPIVTLLNPEFEFTDLSINGYSLIWSFGDSTNSIESNPIHEYSEIGLYIVTLDVTSIFGCTDQISKTVEVKPDFFFAMPNTFTPEGDGLNDVFIPGSTVGAIDKNYSFYVYDRWGEIIFEAHDLESGWNGTVRNGKEIVQSGTYVWKISVSDTEGNMHNYTGHVNVLK